MPKIQGVRERRHQPFFDSLVRGIGISTVAAQTSLFGNANVGQRQLTNLQTPGVLAADQTYMIKALRVSMYFQSLADSEFAAFGALTALNTNATGTNSRALDLYPLLGYGAYFELNVGDKPQFFAPLWYAPAGGGIQGFSTENSRNVITNGMPSHTCILKLAKDIHVPARQNFNVNVLMFPFARLGAGQGGAIGADLDINAYLNQFDGIKLTQFWIDGIQTRDVQ
jgi:hypothetical protein